MHDIFYEGGDVSSVELVVVEVSHRIFEEDDGRVTSDVVQVAQVTVDGTV